MKAPSSLLHPRRRDPRQGARRTPRDPRRRARRPRPRARRELRAARRARGQLGADDHAHLPRPRLRRAARVQARAGAGAGARRLAAAPPRQHRRRSRRGGRQDRAQRRRLGGRRAQPARHGRARRPRWRAIASAPHIDIVGAGNTSWFMATDLQARLFRLGLSANAWADYHLQQVAAGAQKRRRRGDRDHARRRHAVAARRGGHRARAGREGGRAHAARHAAGANAPTSLLGLSVPDDAVMHVGIDAYLAHLTVIEILTVLVAQRRRRAGGASACAACARRCSGTASTCARTRCRAGTAEAVTTDGLTRADPARGRPGRRRPRRPVVAAATCCWSATASRASARACASACPTAWPLADVDVVDCRGQVIAPGFIDVHTHDDAIVLRDPDIPAQAVAGHHDGDHRQLRHLARAATRTDAPPPPLTLLGADSFRYPTMARLPRRGERGAAGAQRRRAGRPHDAALRDDGPT